MKTPVERLAEDLRRLRTNGSPGISEAEVVRAYDGRSRRRTGRTIKYGSVVSVEFRAWMTAVAKKRGLRQAALLEEMRLAHIKVHGDG